jgi:hypothetical protein
VPRVRQPRSIVATFLAMHECLYSIRAPIVVPRSPRRPVGNSFPRPLLSALGRPDVLAVGGATAGLDVNSPWSSAYLDSCGPLRTTARQFRDQMAAGQGSQGRGARPEGPRSRRTLLRRKVRGRAVHLIRSPKVQPLSPISLSAGQSLYARCPEPLRYLTAMEAWRRGGG